MGWVLVGRVPMGLGDFRLCGDVVSLLTGRVLVVWSVSDFDSFFESSALRAWEGA